MVGKNEQKTTAAKRLRRARKWSKVVKAGEHYYTLDNDLGVWHWQTTNENGAIGWRLIEEACDVEDAEMLIAEHSATTPVDPKANRWTPLPLRLTD